MDIKQLVLKKLESNKDNFQKTLDNYEAMKKQYIIHLPDIVNETKIKMQYELSLVPEKIDKAESQLVMSKLVNDDNQWQCQNKLNKIENTEKTWLYKINYEIPESTKQWDDDIRLTKQLIYDITKIINDINNLTFTTDNVPENCLSSYFTYCNRYNFWYTHQLLNFTPEQIIQIIMCEYFNSMQEYFIKGKFKGSPIVYQGISLLMMRYIDIVKEKIPFAQQIRTQIIQKMKTKFPNLNAITFGPNNYAAKHLFFTMIYNDKDQRISNTTKLVSEDNKLECYETFPFYYFPRAGGLTLKNDRRSGEVSQYNRDTQLILIYDGKLISNTSNIAHNWLYTSGYNQNKR